VVKAGKKKKKIGIQDIANVLNISASTVSRALNGNPHISDVTKEKVKVAASRLGYHPGIPELMSPEKAEAIVVFVPSLKDNLYIETVLGITNFMNKNKYHTFIVDTQGSDDNVNSFFDNYKKFGISGMIHILSERNLPEDFYSLIQNDTMPLVTVFKPDTELGISSVLPDIFQGVSKIVRYLRTLKISRVALILDDNSRPEDFQIASSFEMALDTLGMKEHISTSVMFTADRRREPLAGEIRHLLTAKDRPQALLVKGARATMETLKIAEKLDMKVPDDFILIEIGTSHFLNMTGNLSLLRLPAYEMGYEAAEILIRQIQNTDNDQKTAVKPVSFILKGSAIRIK